MCKPGASRSFVTRLLNSSNSIEKESSFSHFIVGLGRGAVIALIVASAINMAALQESIAAPTQAFRGCLRDAAAKATNEKVSGDAIEEYLKNACSVQMGTLKTAISAFRMKNGMSKKAAASDADMTVDDYVSTPVDNYKFMASQMAPAAPAPKTPAPATTAPVTPAATQPH
jgi:hypothetical protein